MKKKKLNVSRPARDRSESAGAFPPERANLPQGISGTSRDFWSDIGVCIFLTALTWLVFAQTLHFDFVNYNDDIYVYDNPAVTKGLSVQAIGWAFTHSQVANWIPLTVLSHMLDCQIFGLNAGGHHLTNAVIHTGTVILLFLVLRLITGSLWRSAFVAAIFAIHPLRAESVAWVSERKDVLSGFFFFLTIAAYALYVKRPSPVRYVLMLFPFVLGLLCKSMIATLPFVLILLDYWPLRRFSSFEQFRRILPEKIPLVILSVGGCIAAAMAPGLLITGIRQLPFFERAEVALLSCVGYLWKTVFPHGLAIPYPYPADFNNLLAWKTCSAFAALIIISAVVMAGRKKYPYLLFGWLWYLGMLFPVLGFIQITSVAADADRYTYLPGIGLSIAVAWAVTDLSIAWKHQRQFVGGLAIGIVGICTFCGYKQTSFWRNSETLWERTIACTAPNIIALNNLGMYLIQHGQADQGIAQLKKSLGINPSDNDARIDLGMAFFAKGDTDDAIIQYNDALEIDPEDEAARNDLGNALIKIGRTDEGIAQFQRILKVDPANVDARFNFGVALMVKGNLTEAISQYQKALEYDPDDGGIRNNLAYALIRNGELEEGVAQYRKVLQTTPDSVEVRNNLGVALMAKGDLTGAIGEFRRALEVAPDHAESLKNLGIALLQYGDHDAALSCFTKILNLGSDSLTRWYHLGNYFLESGSSTEAIICYQQALQINPHCEAACSQLAASYFEQKNDREAINLWQRALALSPVNVDVLNNLAWLLATSPDLSLRDGPKAVTLAKEASLETNTNNPTILRTLAAAYAEVGRYSEATVAARTGLALAVKQTNNVLASNLRGEIELYREADDRREIEP